MRTGERTGSRTGLRAHASTPQISEDWQLDPDYYVAAKMAMTPVYPRSQVSIDGGAKSGVTWARHLYAYPNIQYRIPIVIQGGSYPFKFELTTAPAGMSLGETYGSTASPTTDYGIITWTAPSSGTYTVKVTIYDQEYGRGSTEITLEWDIEVTATPFRFVQQGATGGDGLSAASPWGSVDDWYGANQDDTAAWTAGARIIYYLDGGGNIDFWQTSGDPSNQNLNMKASGGTPVKPLIHLAYPGDSPVCKFYDGASNGGSMRISSSDCTDLFIGGLTMDSIDAQMSNARGFQIVASSPHQHTFFEVTFQNADSAGTSGADNPQVIYYSGATSPNQREYTAITHCTLSACVIGWKFYGNKYGVFERNTLINHASTSSNGEQPVELKGNVNYITVRDNVGVTNNFSIKAFVKYGGGYGGDCTRDTHIEVCYNRFIHNTKSSGNINTPPACLQIGNAGCSSYDSNFWAYRNTSGGIVCEQTNAGACTSPAWENDVIVNDNTGRGYIVTCDGSKPSTGIGANGELIDDWTNADRPIDANGLLQNGTTAWRTLYLGKKGAEIVAP